MTPITKKVYLSDLNDILRLAREIAALDKDQELSCSADAYARALGRANGKAKSIVITLESILEAQR